MEGLRRRGRGYLSPDDISRPPNTEMTTYLIRQLSGVEYRRAGESVEAIGVNGYRVQKRHLVSRLVNAKSPDERKRIQLHISRSATSTFLRERRIHHGAGTTEAWVGPCE